MGFRGSFGSTTAALRVSCVDWFRLKASSAM